MNYCDVRVGDNMIEVFIKGPIHSKFNCLKKTARKTELNVCRIPLVNCAVLCVKDDWKGQS